VSGRKLAALFVFVLAGCGGGTRLGEGSTAVRVASALPPPDTTTVPLEIAPYRIAPGDEIAVTIFGAPELDRAGIVDAAGNFSLPLAGAIVAAGRTPDQLAREVEGRLKGPYLKNPRVAVNVKQAGNQQTVTIDGEVAQPGIYPVNRRMTLQQAIATARGASETANIKNVVVFRTVNGQKMAAMFDLHAIRSGRSPDPEIYGNDIVVVGESAVQRFLRNFGTGIPILGRFIPFVL
jgi:polysaccharide biosynthesis/export protein